MMKKTSIASVIALSVLAFSGCISLSFNSPANSTVVLHTLETSVPTTGTQKIPAVQFSKISLPGYLDVPQIVTRDDNNAIRKSGANVWAEPLERAVRRTIPRQVGILVKGKQLKEFSKVSVSIDRLEGSLDSSVTLSAQIVLLPKKQTEDAGSVPAALFTVSVPVAHPNYSDYVSAISEALNALSREIAEQITNQ